MTIPPYYPGGGPGGVVFSSQSCTADFTTDAISVQAFKSLSFEFDWSSFNATGGATFTLQVSNSNSLWNDKTDATFTVAAASGAQIINLNETASEGYYRVAYVKNSNSTGSASCYMVGK